MLPLELAQNGIVVESHWCVSSQERSFRFLFLSHSQNDLGFILVVSWNSILATKWRECCDCVQAFSVINLFSDYEYGKNTR